MFEQLCYGSIENYIYFQYIYMICTNHSNVAKLTLTEKIITDIDNAIN